MSEEEASNTCSICGGIVRIEYSIAFVQCRPCVMRVDPVEVPRLCMGHPVASQVEQFRTLLELGLTADEPRRKQWVLWRIGAMFDIDLSNVDDEDKGIAP